MRAQLESPGDDGSPNWDALYLARGTEIAAHRPYFTGDVFGKVSVRKPDGTLKAKTVAIIQHPCAMRADGVNLSPSLLVAEVRPTKVLPPSEWAKYGKLAPLPDLLPSVTSNKRNQAAYFDALYLAQPEDLEGGRIACLSQLGVNLLLQRWVHHSSRVVVPTWTLNEVTGGVYEECDLIEEWCEERIGPDLPASAATRECVDWLREERKGDESRQKLLENPQFRGDVRREMRQFLKSL